MYATGTIENLREQGAALLKEKKFTDAITALNGAAAENPGDEVVWRLLGVAYSSLNTPDGHAHAENAFERVVTLAPSAARNHFNLAVAQQASGNGEAARQSLERALALEPTYEQARARLESLPPTSSPLPADGTVVLSRGDSGGMPGLASVGSVFAPPQPDSGGTTNLGGGNSMGLMGVGEDWGYVAPPTAPAVPHAAAPAAVGGVPNLRPAESVPGAPTGSIYYDQMSRAESNAYLTGVYGIKNTSGMQGTVPPEIANGFNWGAAVYPFWWLRNHHLQPLGIGLVVFYIALSFVPFGQMIVWAVQVVMFFVMGFMGNRLGWQNRTFDDVDDFRACQRIWALCAIPQILCCLGYGYFLLTAAQAAHQVTQTGMGRPGF